MTIRLAPETAAAMLRAVDAANAGGKRTAAAAALTAALLRMPAGRGPFYATIELLGEGGRVVASGKRRVTKRGEYVGKSPAALDKVSGFVTGVRIRMPSGATITHDVALDRAPAQIGRLRLPPKR